jgi:hypothetical protein
VIPLLALGWREVIDSAGAPVTTVGVKRGEYHRPAVCTAHGVADRCACPEVGNDPDALLAQWAYEDAIDAAAIAADAEEGE